MSGPTEDLFDLEDPDTKERALAEASAQLDAAIGRTPRIIGAT